ncbi:MAG: hypothetical protein ISR48_00670 [Alphaproteobacteria bacterium]|nr:hypothetical protein [Alphaproteobacteria bacterium]
MSEDPFTLVREMGVTTCDDFLRLIPAAARAAVGDAPMTISENSATLGEGEKRVEITLVEMAEKRLGAFRLPRIEASFAFYGYSDEERIAFLERFDRVTQRGGG